MAVSPRVLEILRSVARYGVLTAAQIRALCFPNIQSDGSNVRSRLRDMVQQKLLNRTHMQVVQAGSPMSAPVYYSSPLGIDTLVCELNDESYRSVSTRAPQWQHLAHYVAISDVHVVADQAIGKQNYATLERWVNEYDIFNPQAQKPSEKFSLYTLIREEPRLVSVPDAGFVIGVPHEGQVFRKAFYLELERATNPTQRVAAEKSPGYFAMQQGLLHKKHFPNAMDQFTVLVTAPDARWRDALRKSFASKEGEAMYRFAATPELTPDSFLFGNVWYACTGDAVPLVKPPVAGGAK